MAERLIELDVRAPKQWRQWLAKHHVSSPGIWLVRHKQHTGVDSMPYEDLTGGTRSRRRPDARRRAVGARGARMCAPVTSNARLTQLAPSSGSAYTIVGARMAT